MGLDHAFIVKFYDLLCNNVYKLCDNALQIVGNICMIECVSKAKNTSVREHNLRGSENK